jgi:molybdopterin-guanine dinucleotide biosynthesis protein MobB
LRTPAIAFVGKQNSGKTTLLEKLIASLTANGVNVGTLKHHSHAGFEFDIEGKDSWRHAQAGSSFSVVSAPDKIAMVRKLDQPEEAAQTIAAMIALSSTAANTKPLDVVLVEGYRHANLPTIELFRAANPKDIDRELGTEGNEIIGVVTDIERVQSEAAALQIPCFTFEQIAQLTDYLQEVIKYFSG